MSERADTYVTIANMASRSALTCSNENKPYRTRPQASKVSKGASREGRQFRKFHKGEPGSLRNSDTSDRSDSPAFRWNIDLSNAAGHLLGGLEHASQKLTRE